MGRRKSWLRTAGTVVSVVLVIIGLVDLPEQLAKWELLSRNFARRVEPLSGDVLRSLSVIAGVVMGLMAWDVPQRLIRRFRPPVAEILEETIAGFRLQTLLESSGWQLRLKFANPTAQPLTDCRAEIHALQRYSVSNREFIQDAESFGRARLKFEETEVSKATIGGESSLSCLLADAHQKTTLRVAGDIVQGPSLYRRIPLISEGGIWREEILLHTNQGDHRLQLFFEWRPGHQPKFVCDPREHAGWFYGA